MSKWYRNLRDIRPVQGVERIRIWKDTGKRLYALVLTIGWMEGLVTKKNALVYCTARLPTESSRIFLFLFLTLEGLGYCHCYVSCSRTSHTVLISLLAENSIVGQGSIYLSDMLKYIRVLLAFGRIPAPFLSKAPTNLNHLLDPAARLWRHLGEHAAYVSLDARLEKLKMALQLVINT